MPGIVGLITRAPNRDEGERQLSAMLQSMLHERFYTHGTYVRPDKGWYLGWTNHPGSFSDVNPVMNGARDASRFRAASNARTLTGFGLPRSTVSRTDSGSSPVLACRSS